MPNVRDVAAHIFIKEYADHLRRSGEFDHQPMTESRAHRCWKDDKHWAPEQIGSWLSRSRTSCPHSGCSKTEAGSLSTHASQLRQNEKAAREGCPKKPQSSHAGSAQSCSGSRNACALGVMVRYASGNAARRAGEQQAGRQAGRQVTEELVFFGHHQRTAAATRALVSGTRFCHQSLHRSSGRPATYASVNEGWMTDRGRVGSVGLLNVCSLSRW